jgi:hypothetical protein
MSGRTTSLRRAIELNQFFVLIVWRRLLGNSANRIQDATAPWLDKGDQLSARCRR